MKKILFFETSSFTGATRVTHILAKSAKRRYDVSIAQVGDNYGKDIEFAIEKEHPDILFSSFIQINPEVIQAGKRHSLYVIIRNDYKLEDVVDDVRLRAIKTYPLADEIIAQTEEMRQSLLTIPAIVSSKVRVLENPLDEEDILEKAKEPNPFHDNGYFHFLWVGRKVPIKDLLTLQKAFEIVHEKNPKTDLTLISKDLNPYKWMRYADCMVISSKSEASPNVLREALFLGTSVVSTDCSSSVKELLPESRIAQVGNPIDLAEKMTSVLLENIV